MLASALSIGTGAWFITAVVPMRLRNPFTGELVYDRHVTAAERRARDLARWRTKRLAREIVAWDGEGLAVPEGTPQPYVLLANSVGSEWMDRNGLDTTTCLEALLVTARAHRGARHVAFGLSYDVNMWLRDLDHQALLALWKQGWCWWRDYRLEYRPRRSFAVKRIATGESVMVWDIQTWFGGDLVSAIADWLPDAGDAQTIAAGKARRRAFHWRELDGIRAYQQAELRVTVQLTRALLTELDALGLRPSRLDGPGGAAAAVLRQQGVKTELGGPWPREFERAALCAYAGGRIEPVQFGVRDGPLYEYDLHAAYGWAMAQLPGLAGVRWRWRPGGGVDHSPWALYRVRWTQPRAHAEGRSPWYPFAWRDRSGGIFFPSAGEGWVWAPELAAYEDTAANYDCRVEVIGAYEPLLGEANNGFQVRPFSFMSGLYEKRHAETNLDAPHADALVKATMNACYGKLVQAVGWRDQPPPYYSIVWGGLVTSLVRARMLRAAAVDPEAVVMFATDALFTTRQLRGLAAQGDGMGQWGRQRHEQAVVVQSGVYLLRAAERDGWRAVARGYSLRGLGGDAGAAAGALRDRILGGWADGAPAVTVDQERFVSLASELERGPVPAWRSWVTEPVSLELWPTGKRTGGDGSPLAGLVRSRPMPVVENLQPRPRLGKAYARTWTLTPQAVTDGVSPIAYEEEIEEAVL